MKRKHPDSRCEDCSLYPNKMVPTVATGKIDFAIVGEAPGKQEAAQGKPFVGASGKLLDAVLAEHKIPRDRCMITNVVLCHPDDNATPSKNDIACCSDRLKKEVTLADPLAIIALGNTATSAIMGTPVKITTFRAGPAKTSPLYPQTKVIPTFHPAACLRSSDNFPSLVTDIGKAVQRAATPWSPPEYRVFDDGDAEKALQLLVNKYDTFVIDIETTSEKDSSFEHSHLMKLLCVGIAYAPGKAVVITDKALERPHVQRLLAELMTKKIIAHNGKYDLPGLARFGPSKLYFDTMLASYVVDERAGVHGLKYLAVELLGAPQYDLAVKKYKDYGDIPRDMLYEYNAYDVACTWLLYEYYVGIFTDENWKLHNFLVDASNEIMHLEMGGIKIDTEALEKLDGEYTTTLATLERNLFKWVDNPRSPIQVKKALLDLGYDVASTNVETLEGLPQTEFVDRMLEYRKQHKLKSTYIDGIRKRLHDGRVHPTFLLHGTTTGRLSCRNPNAQNIPRGSAIRSLFIPAPGNVFIQADYSQAELRTVASLAEDVFLRDVFMAGRDIHSEVAARFFGPDFTKEQRVKAKMVVFGLTYAMTPHGLARRMNISLTEATEYQKTFFSTIPQVVAWREQVKDHLLNSSEDLVTPFGRHRRYTLITRENQEEIIKEGTAFLPQSIASDICLEALVHLSRNLPAPAVIRFPVHDSILVECPKDMADEVEKQMVYEMEESGRRFTNYVPYAVDVKVSDESWGEM